MQSPLISIVTPSYNAARFLPKCLASVAPERRAGVLGWLGAREALPIEHILMDGGSSDGSKELLEAHVRRWPGLVTRVESARDRGQSDAINRGLSEARGVYGAWLNADDWYEPGALAAVVRFLWAHPEVDVLVGRARLVDEAGRVVWAPTPPEPVTLAELLRLRSRWFAGRSLLQPEVFFRREMFVKLGGLDVDNHYSMDHELWCRMAASGARFASIGRLVATQLAHAGQKTARRVDSLRCVVERSRRLLAKHQDVLGKDAADVERELSGIERKLAIAGPWLRAWRDGGAPSEDAPIAWTDPARAAVAELWAQLIPAMRDAEMASPAETLVLERHGGGAPIPVEVGRGAAHHGLDDIERLVRERRRFDRVVTSGVLCRSGVGAAMSGMWEMVRPGGVFVQGPEPLDSQELRASLLGLVDRVTGQLAADHDAVLDIEADDTLARLRPGPMGVDPDALMAATAPQAERVWIGRAGGLASHPIRPFVLKGQAGGSGSGWVASVWRKPMRLA